VIKEGYWEWHNSIYYPSNPEGKKQRGSIDLSALGLYAGEPALQRGSCVRGSC
jgi:hypothetical protein